jgi:hypothetical protein
MVPYEAPLEESAWQKQPWQCHITDDDDEDLAALHIQDWAEEEDDDDDGLDVVNQMIAETSLRWKNETEALVSTTRTASAVQAAQAVVVTQPEEEPADIIQAQQAEIAALKQALHKAQSQQVSSLPSSSEDDDEEEEDTPEETIDVAPIEHIEVNAADASWQHDDLTVWSGFQSHVQDRPDAESTTGATPLTGNRRHVSGLPIDLVSAVTGVTRHAVYSGTCQGHAITGTGVLRFETGDVYKGDVVDGEMHGTGTYTFAAGRRKVLQGTFEHNVFVGGGL